MRNTANRCGTRSSSVNAFGMNERIATAAFQYANGVRDFSVACGFVPAVAVKMADALGDELFEMFIIVTQDR